MRNKMRRLKAVFGAMVVTGTMLVGSAFEVGAVWQSRHDTSWVMNSESSMCDLRRATSVDIPRSESVANLMMLKGNVVNRYHHSCYNYNKGYIDAACIKADDLDISVGFDYEIDGSKLTITDVYGVVSGINSDVETEIGEYNLIIPDAVTFNGYSSYDNTQLTVQDLLDPERIKRDTGVFKSINSIAMSQTVKNKFAADELEIRRVVLDTESVKQMNSNVYYEITLGKFVDDFNLEAEINDDNNIGVENVAEITVDEGNQWYYSENGMLFAKDVNESLGADTVYSIENSLVWCPPEILMSAQTNQKCYKTSTGKNCMKLEINNVDSIFNTAFDNFNASNNCEIVFGNDVTYVNIAAKRMKKVPSFIKIDGSSTTANITSSADNKLIVKRWYPDGFDTSKHKGMYVDSNVVVSDVERKTYNAEALSSVLSANDSYNGCVYAEVYNIEPMGISVADVVSCDVSANGCFPNKCEITCDADVDILDIMSDLNKSNIMFVYDNLVTNIPVREMNINCTTIDQLMSTSAGITDELVLNIPYGVERINFAGNMFDLGKWLSYVTVSPDNPYFKVEKVDYDRFELYNVKTGKTIVLAANKALAPPLAPPDKDINNDEIFKKDISEININGNVCKVSYTYHKSYDGTVVFPDEIQVAIKGAAAKGNNEIFRTITDADVMTAVKKDVESTSMTLTTASSNVDKIYMIVEANESFCKSIEANGYTKLHISKDVNDISGIQSSVRVNNLFEEITVDSLNTNFKMTGKYKHELMNIIRGNVVMCEKPIVTEEVESLQTGQFIADKTLSILVDGVYYAPVFDFTVTQTHVSDNQGTDYMKNDTKVVITDINYTISDIPVPKNKLNTVITLRDDLKNTDFSYIDGEYAVEPEVAATGIKHYASSLENVDAKPEDIGVSIIRVIRNKWTTTNEDPDFSMKYVQTDLSKFAANLNKWDTVNCLGTVSPNSITNIYQGNIISDKTLLQVGANGSKRDENCVFGHNASYKTDMKPSIVINSEKTISVLKGYVASDIVSAMNKNIDGIPNIVFGPDASNISYINNIIQNDKHQGMSIITILDKDADVGTVTEINDTADYMDTTGKYIEIHGYEGSTAQAYAEAIGARFFELPSKNAECAKMFLNRTVLGDADDDNDMALGDTIAVAKYNVSSSQYPLSLQGLCNADMNNDGYVDNIDANIMIEINLGKVDYNALCEKYK